MGMKAMKTERAAILIPTITPTEGFKVKVEALVWFVGLGGEAELVVAVGIADSTDDEEPLAVILTYASHSVFGCARGQVLTWQIEFS
ncbi:hypothetical protein B7463_g835, partial [Scytalidium lignicola]